MRILRSRWPPRCGHVSSLRQVRSEAAHFHQLSYISRVLPNYNFRFKQTRNITDASARRWASRRPLERACTWPPQAAMLVAGAALVARTRSSPPTSIHLRGALSCAQGKPSRAFATRATESRGEARHASPVRASTASAGAAIRSNLLKSLACRNSTLHRPLKGGLASRTARLSLGRGSSERRRDKSGTGGRHGAGQALSTMSGTVSNEDDEVWTPPQPPEGLSFLQRVWWRMGKEAIVAPPNFNRYVRAADGTHPCVAFSKLLTSHVPPPVTCAAAGLACLARFWCR